MSLKDRDRRLAYDRQRWLVRRDAYNLQRRERRDETTRAAERSRYARSPEVRAQKKAGAKRWTRANPAGRAAVERRRVTSWLEVARELLAELKAGGCVDCGTLDVRVIDFDHVRGVKFGNVAAMAYSRVPWPRVLDEVAKCELRCANCHRVKTWERRRGLS